GATESLNLFLHGFLRPGDKVLTTALEHSSVVRPLTWQKEHAGVELTVLAPDSQGYVDASQVTAALQQGGHRLLVFTHASNVIGSVLDAAAFCRLARNHGCVTLLDASQTAGLLPLAVGADAVVASAHKSLLGPPGLGFLCVGAELCDEIRLVKQGGTGSSRALAQHPREWPAAMEAGTPNTPAILGLLAALRWLDGQDPEESLHHGLACVDTLRATLKGHARCLGPSPDTDRPDAGGNNRRIAVLSLVPNDLDPAEAGLLLSEAGIHVRAGYHCAPWVHEHLGTAAGGTLRISPGPFTTTDDVLAVPRALACG
ncbi:MAG: aminotransferase class V-fold PLP-dependent enzyme, partial [Planctomycetota bacterium]